MSRTSKPRSTSPFRYFNSSPEVIRLVVMMYVRFPLSLRNVEDLLAERGIDICHETVRHWWNRFGPLFAADVRRQRTSRMRGFRQWKWHLDEGGVRVTAPPEAVGGRQSVEGEYGATVGQTGSGKPVFALVPRARLSDLDPVRELPYRPAAKSCANRPDRWQHPIKRKCSKWYCQTNRTLVRFRSKRHCLSASDPVFRRTFAAHIRNKTRLLGVRMTA
jgi:hypothetical protein